MNEDKIMKKGKRKYFNVKMRNMKLFPSNENINEKFANVN